MNKLLIRASLDQVVLALDADDPVVGALHATVAQTLATLAAADAPAAGAGAGPGRPARAARNTVSETFSAWSNDIDWLNTVAGQPSSAPPETPEVARPDPTRVILDPPGRLRRNL